MLKIFFNIKYWLNIMVNMEFDPSSEWTLAVHINICKSHENYHFKWRTGE